MEGLALGQGLVAAQLATKHRSNASLTSLTRASRSGCCKVSTWTNSLAETASGRVGCSTVGKDSSPDFSPSRCPGCRSRRKNRSAARFRSHSQRTFTTWRDSDGIQSVGVPEFAGIPAILQNETRTAPSDRSAVARSISSLSRLSFRRHDRSRTPRESKSDSRMSSLSMNCRSSTLASRRPSVVFPLARQPRDDDKLPVRHCPISPRLPPDNGSAFSGQQQR